MCAMFHLYFQPAPKLLYIKLIKVYAYLRANLLCLLNAKFLAHNALLHPKHSKQQITQ